MIQICVQLSATDDAAIRAVIILPSGVHRHLVPAFVAAGIQASAVSLLEGFETERRPLADPVDLHNLGHSLREAFLFPGYEEILASVAMEPTRLLVQSTTPALLNLPWELLPGASRRFIVDDRRFFLRRTSQEILHPMAGSSAAPPIRILFATCAPVDQSGLDFEREEDAMLKIARKIGAKVHLDFADAGTFEELRELIETQQPHVVHLSGHGVVREGIGAFAFEDERGDTDFRDAHQMAEQLFAGRNVRLVFVNGCQTAQAAVAGICQTLTATGHVPFALGWGARIADDFATDFVHTFYSEVARHSIDGALTAARRAMLKKCKLKAGQFTLMDASFALPRLYGDETDSSLVDHSLPHRPPKRPSLRYEYLGNGIVGLTEGFVGRRREFQRTRPVFRSGERTFLLLTGMGGAGKSTFATKLANHCAQEGFFVLALKAISGQADRFSVMLILEFAAACESLGKPDDASRLRDCSATVSERLSYVVDLMNREPLMLVLDNLEVLMSRPGPKNQWIEPDFATFFTRLTSELTGAGRVVATCRYVPRSFDPKLRQVMHEVISDFTSSDFIKYLMRHPKLARRIRNGTLSVALLEKFQRQFGSTPRFLEQACVLLETLGPRSIDRQLSSLVSNSASTQPESRPFRKLQRKYVEELLLSQLYVTLSLSYRLALSKLSVVEHPLPRDGVWRVAGMKPREAGRFVREAVAAGLLQVFREGSSPASYRVYGLQRSFLMAPRRLPRTQRRSAHAEAGRWFQEEYRKTENEELTPTLYSTLNACLHHFKEAGDLPQEIWAAERLGSALIRHGEYEAALRMAQPLLNTTRHPDILNIVSRCKTSTGQWAEGRTLIAEELSLRQKQGDLEGEAVAWHALASLDLQVGDNPRARAGFAQASAGFKTLGFERSELVVITQLGYMDMIEGRNAEARQKFEHCLALRDLLDNPGKEAVIWHNLATLDMEEGRYDAAVEGFHQALALKQRIGHRDSEAATWQQLATIDFYRGEYAAASEKYSKALVIYSEIGNSVGEANALHNLATIDLENENDEEALEKFSSALHLVRMAGDRDSEAATLHQLATLQLAKNQLPAARENLETALAIQREIKDASGEATTLHQLSLVDDEEGDLAAASQRLQAALAIRQTISDRLGEAQTFAQMGYLASRFEDYASATSLTAISETILQAIEIKRETISNNLADFSSKLAYGPADLDSLLRKATSEYQHDRGAAIVRHAFADRSDNPSSPQI